MKVLWAMAQENIGSLPNLGGTFKTPADFQSNAISRVTTSSYYYCKRGANSCISHVTNSNYYVCVCNSRDKYADQLNPFKFQRTKTQWKVSLIQQVFYTQSLIFKAKLFHRNFCHNEFIFNVLEQIQMITFKAEVCCERWFFMHNQNGAVSI